MLNGKILITGGSGFLGRAILRKAKEQKWDAKFTIYSRDETKQWELKHKYPDVTCVLGDVSRDLDRLTAVMAGHDVVIHAAAVKYIPEAEWNVYETIDVNIEGSRNVTISARAAGVGKVIGISTDKACSPLNVYGMTKAIMERMFSEANRMGTTRFVTVRYGNVIGSTGSVIPLFEKQIIEDGELKVTDSRMTRFWLGADEAVGLIDWAVSNSELYPGYTFISPCPAMKIVDIARAVYRMYYKGGTKEEEDDRITFTGIRPGEKLHESLFNEQEAPRTSRLPAGYILAPATNAGKTMPDRMMYSSEHPDRDIRIDEMIKLIEDAKEI
jgi:UDP-N-acetylglucosamine 4,6-dehydratase/5-epimerase